MRGWSYPLWTQDEAGPYQTKPYPGASWQKEGQPARQSHEYVRNGTAKILTLFHPLTGQVRVKGVISSANVVLHTPAQRRIEVNPSDASALRSWIKKQIDPYGKPGKKFIIALTLPEALPALRMRQIKIDCTPTG